MPGCGKSTIGALISKLTQKNFVDCDDEFKKKFDITPSEAIKAFGEEKFRQMEHEVTLEVGKRTNCVIATGGGVVTRKENYEPLHQNGKIFFIDRPIELLQLHRHGCSAGRHSTDPVPGHDPCDTYREPPAPAPSRSATDGQPQTGPWKPGNPRVRDS